MKPQPIPNLICRLFGHRASTYGSQGNISAPYHDGIGRAHREIRTECRRCGMQFHVVSVIDTRANETPAEIAHIGKLICTQDNRITDHPIFIVEQIRWIYGVDPDYDAQRVWIHHARDGLEVTDEAEITKLDTAYDGTGAIPVGYTLTGKVSVWEFVTCCFTEHGCEDYIARNGHNLNQHRIYAAGSFRNNEWQTIRKFLISKRHGG